MGSRTPARECLICREHQTRSNAGICYRCRPSPRIYVDGPVVYITGFGPLNHDAALRLAHEICDALTP